MGETRHYGLNSQGQSVNSDGYSQTPTNMKRLNRAQSTKNTRKSTNDRVSSVDRKKKKRSQTPKMGIGILTKHDIRLVAKEKANERFGSTGGQAAKSQTYQR